MSDVELSGVLVSKFVTTSEVGRPGAPNDGKAGRRTFLKGLGTLGAALSAALSRQPHRTHKLVERSTKETPPSCVSPPLRKSSKVTSGYSTQNWAAFGFR